MHLVMSWRFCFFLRRTSVFQPVSKKRELIDTCLVAPVTIRVASCCICCSSFASYCVQLSQTTLEYSSNGLIKQKNIV